jgi:hypothetical protein
VVGREVGAVPELHQSEYALLNPALSGHMISFQEVQSFEPRENPEWEIDLDAGGIEDLAFEFADRASPMLSWLILELQPARVGLDAALMRVNQNHARSAAGAASNTFRMSGTATKSAYLLAV